MTDVYIMSNVALLYDCEKTQFKKILAAPLPASFKKKDSLEKHKFVPPNTKDFMKNFVEDQSRTGKGSSTISLSSGRSTPSLPGAHASVASLGMCLSQSSREVEASIDKWRLFGDKGPPGPHASVLCGPIFLLRLFYKTPEILGKMSLPAKKRKLVVSYFEQLLAFLEANPELFSYLYN